VAANVEPTTAAADTLPRARLGCLLLAALSVAGAAGAAAVGWDGTWAGRIGWICVTFVWAGAGAVLCLRKADERLGLLAVWFAVLAGAFALASAVVRDRPGNGAAWFAVAITVALLPVALMHVLLALPDGSLGSGERRVTVAAGYFAAIAVGLVIWTQRPARPAWPVVIEATLAAAIGVSAVQSRSRAARPDERRRLEAIVLTLALGLEVVLVGLLFHILVRWPPELLQIAAAATVPIPLALLLERSERLRLAPRPAFLRVATLVGLTALVAAVYFVVVAWLGHAPTHDQRTLVGLSVVAAVVCALAYVPLRGRLAVFANKLVHESQEVPDDVVRGFSAHLSRAVPLEDLLLELVESLSTALSLEAAEIWTGSGGMLERVASDPDRDSAWLRLGPAEEAVVAGAGVSGPVWLAVWLPQFLHGRGDADVRVAPVARAGELHGLIVAERAREETPFDEEAERVLSELAGQVGLVLRNVRLDAQLEASLDELRGQAAELRASRARVVAAADAERRRIERDLHDGAQQYLAGLGVNLRVARGLVDSDPEKAKEILDDVQRSAQVATEAFRHLAHGVYPQLLQDRGVADALADAARRAPILTSVATPGLRRYDADVEATVYFCCLEALQNAGKHAGERARARVRVWEEAGALLFEVADDGAGGVREDMTDGAGITNMRDRLGAIGGSLRIESAHGRGTRIRGVVPLGS
jgi:signal transduction histidine kinase